MAPGRSAPHLLGRRLAAIADFYEVLSKKLRALRQRPDDPEASAADREREAREFHVLMRSYEKLNEFEERARAEQKRLDGGQEEPTMEAARDAERWRNEIAQLIQGLASQEK